MAKNRYYLPLSPIPYRIICRLSNAMAKKLKFGLNLINGISDVRNEFGPLLVPLLIYQNEDQTLIICRNLCRHAGGNFLPDIEDGPEIVRCTYHGWKLNSKTLEYIRPSNGLKQKQLIFEKQTDGELLILEAILDEPWLEDKQEKQQLEENELTITYINNASIEIKGGNERLITDPWLIGPSFGRGCWLYHQNADDVFDRVANVNAIFISKSSSDHFHLPTLRKIAQINRDIQIYIPQFPIDYFKDQFKELGFRNVQKVPFGIWQNLKGKQFRFLILPDHKLPNIQCVILIEYKGHQILNLADSREPNGNYLPYGVDVLLSSFTSNTGPFPSCFIEQFDQEKIIEIFEEKDQRFAKRIIKFIQLSNPSLWIPFANYFIQSDSNDGDIPKINLENTLQSLIQTLQSRFPLLNYWKPFPDGKYDLATQIGDQPTKTIQCYLNKVWQFQPYIDQLDQSLQFQPLQTIEGVKEYFQWANFHNYDLILHIIETNNDFSLIIREYFIDFLSSNAIFVNCCPQNRPLLRIRCRASVLRDIYLRGYSWSNLSNGFSGRYFLQPNISHSKFWNHFKYNLPLDPPQWMNFNEDIPSNLLQYLDQWETNNSRTNQRSFTEDHILTTSLDSISLR